MSHQLFALDHSCPYSYSWWHSFNDPSSRALPHDNSCRLFKHAGRGMYVVGELLAVYISRKKKGKVLHRPLYKHDSNYFPPAF